MTISVIMPVHLGAYDGAATSRAEKFKRAVRSYLEQDLHGTELVVVSDGCEQANAVFAELYDPVQELLAQTERTLRLIRMKKQPLFSGAVRNCGIAEAAGDIIAYLDSDDVIMPGHLAAVHAAFHPPAGQEWLYRQWVYFNDFVAGPGPTIARERHTSLRYGGIGAGSFAHERRLDISWPDGYGHDWGVIEQLMTRYPHTRKVFGPRYLACHVPPDTDY